MMRRICLLFLLLAISLFFAHTAEANAQQVSFVSTIIGSTRDEQQLLCPPAKGNAFTSYK